VAVIWWETLQLHKNNNKCKFLLVVYKERAN